MTTPSDSRDRRQAPRVDLLSEFQGHLITLDQAVLIQQLGPGGLTIACDTPLSPAHVHDIQLTLDDRAVTVKARVVHTRMTVNDGDEFTYVSGLAFIDPAPEAVEAITTFLAQAEARGDARVEDEPA